MTKAHAVHAVRLRTRVAEQTLLFLLMYSLKSSSLVMTALEMRGW